jgi:hypothetical protein
MQEHFHSNFMPRQRRDHDRGTRAGILIHARGGSALDAALASIDATFGEAYWHNQRKLTVERILRRGAESIDTQLRFLEYFAQFERDRFTLDQACDAVALADRLERKKLVRISGIGHRHYNILRDLHLTLRFMRAKGLRAEFNRAVYGTDDVPLIPVAPDVDLVPA